MIVPDRPHRLPFAVIPLLVRVPSAVISAPSARGVRNFRLLRLPSTVLLFPAGAPLPPAVAVTSASSACAAYRIHTAPSAYHLTTICRNSRLAAAAIAASVAASALTAEPATTVSATAKSAAAIVTATVATVFLPSPTVLSSNAAAHHISTPAVFVCRNSPSSACRVADSP